MKREQIEKIARAAITLREAVGPSLAYYSVTDTGGDPRINFEMRDDDSFHAIATLFGAEAHRSGPSTYSWWWFAHVAIDGMDLYFQSPSHRKEPAVEVDDAKVDAAIAQANNATNTVSSIASDVTLTERSDGTASLRIKLEPPIDDDDNLDECADCGGSTAVGTPDPHECAPSRFHYEDLCVCGSCCYYRKHPQIPRPGAGAR